MCLDVDFRVSVWFLICKKALLEAGVICFFFFGEFVNKLVCFMK